MTKSLHENIGGGGFLFESGNNFVKLYGSRHPDMEADYSYGYSIGVFIDHSLMKETLLEVAKNTKDNLHFESKEEFKKFKTTLLNNCPNNIAVSNLVMNIETIKETVDPKWINGISLATEQKGDKLYSGFVFSTRANPEKYKIDFTNVANELGFKIPPKIDFLKPNVTRSHILVPKGLYSAIE